MSQKLPFLLAQKVGKNVYNVSSYYTADSTFPTLSASLSLPTQVMIKVRP